MIPSQSDSPSGHGRQSGVRGSVENEMLHDLLLDWCSNHNVDPNSNDARVIAHELADLFEFGVRDNVDLQKAIDLR